MKTERWGSTTTPKVKDVAGWKGEVNGEQALVLPRPPMEGKRRSTVGSLMERKTSEKKIFDRKSSSAVVWPHQPSELLEKVRRLETERTHLQECIFHLGNSLSETKIEIAQSRSLKDLLRDKETIINNLINSTSTAELALSKISQRHEQELSHEREKLLAAEKRAVDLHQQNERTKLSCAEICSRSVDMSTVWKQEAEEHHNTIRSLRADLLRLETQNREQLFVSSSLRDSLRSLCQPTHTVQSYDGVPCVVIPMHLVASTFACLTANNISTSSNPDERDDYFNNPIPEENTVSSYLYKVGSFRAPFNGKKLRQQKSETD